MGEVWIHGLGAAVETARHLAIELNVRTCGALTLATKEASILVYDDFHPLHEVRSYRPPRPALFVLLWVHCAGFALRDADTSGSFHSHPRSKILTGRDTKCKKESKHFCLCVFLCLCQQHSRNQHASTCRAEGGKEDLKSCTATFPCGCRARRGANAMKLSDTKHVTCWCLQAASLSYRARPCVFATLATLSKVNIDLTISPGTEDHTIQGLSRSSTTGSLNFGCFRFLAVLLKVQFSIRRVT